MDMRPADEPRARIAPLTPYQRPISLLIFLLVPLLGSLVIGWYLYGGEWFYKRFRYSKHATDEVQHNTIETATTANDLLFEFNRRIRAFDAKAREIFGLEHYWHQPSSEPAPDYINEFVQRSSDTRFLTRYNGIAFARREMDRQLDRLESTVDRSITSLTDSSRADHLLRAERLIQKEISNAIEDLEVQLQILELLGQEFNQGVNR